MSAVNEQVVREYFEFCGFLVSQPRKYVASRQRRSAAEEIDLLVSNPNARAHRPPNGLLWHSDDLRSVKRAVVGVCGWHTERVYAKTLDSAPELLTFASAASVKAALERLGPGPLAKIICLPRLPASTVRRDELLAVLKSRGIDGVLTFEMILAELIESVNTQVNYEKSDLLQTVRLLKSYDLVKGPQMELFARGKKRRT